MDGFSRNRAALAEAGVGYILAASVDTGEKAREVADGLDFPVAEGVTREQADALDAWWEDRRSIIQPSEFVLDREGRVVTSTYSSGPIGRMDAEDVAKLVAFHERRRREAAKA